MGCKKSVTGLLLLIRWEANKPVSVPLDTSWQQSINVVNDIRPGSTRGVVQHKSIAAQVDKWTLNVSHYRVTWDKPGQFIKGVKVALNASRRGLQRTEQQHMQKQLCWRWQGPLAPILHNGLFYVVLCTDKERITGNHNGTSHLPAFPYLSSQSAGGQRKRLGKNVSSQRTGKLHPFKCRCQINCDFCLKSYRCHGHRNKPKPSWFGFAEWCPGWCLIDFHKGPAKPRYH